MRIKIVGVKGTRKLLEGEKLSRPQTDEERSKWLKRVNPSKYAFHVGKVG